MNNLEIPAAINVEDEIKTSFLDYSMSVIVSRALPDVRDGLKPVHRRILYGMHLLRNVHNKPYLKSARIIGEVMGKFHPHGDAPIYDALVRMAQDFSLRYPLIDGQGNFGSVDGDMAAAMRYTEARMEELCTQLLADLELGTVDFVPNYDNKETEPLVLPAKVPQLLINGASGIAVGMATNIPPHNLREVSSGLKALIHNPKITILELMEYIKAPDFPTRGEIHGLQGVIEAYHTGRGSVIMRARAHVEVGKGSGRERIIVTEIPYQVNKARLIERIAELVKDKKIEGISDLRDESAKSEMRIVVEIKKGEPSEIILNNLYKMTAMQSSFGINLVALVRGAPKLFNLKQMLEEYYLHRREVVLRRTAFQLKKLEEKAHILLGLKKAVENLDPVLALIRKAANSQEAEAELCASYDLSVVQAKAVLEMRLAKLTGLEREKIVKDYEEIMRQIADLSDILAKPERVTKIILEEIDEAEQRYGDERRTQIIASDERSEISMESLIADEEVAVTVTYTGYVKRTATTEITAQKRGGKGKSGILMKEDDFVQDVFITSNHQDLLCFTNMGKVHSLKVYRLPEANLRSRGKHFANLIKLEGQERVVSVLPVSAFSESLFIFSITKNGYIKKTDLMAYANVRQSGIIGLKLDDGDHLISCCIGSDQEELLVATRMGKSIRFAAEDVRAMGRASRGVVAIRFSDPDDQVIGMEMLRKGEATFVLSVCEKGYGKRTELAEYRSQSRGGKGIYTVKVTEKNGPVIGLCQVQANDEFMIITSAGKLIRLSVEGVGVIGRLTQGVRLMDVAPGERVIGLSKVSH